MQSSPGLVLGMGGSTHGSPFLGPYLNDISSSYFCFQNVQDVYRRVHSTMQVSCTSRVHTWLLETPEKNCRNYCSRGM